MIRKGWFFASLGLLALLLTFLGALPVQADNLITVTTTDDVVDPNDGLCSLREAVISANTNVFNVVGECEAGSTSDTDVIQLTAGETYLLTIDGADEENALTGDLDVLDNGTPEIDVIVQAVGGTAVVQANGTDRVWHVLGAGFQLDGVQTSGGTAAHGGGLYNDDGQVSLENSLFTLNEATSGGAVYSKGASAELRLTNVEISRNMAANPGSGGGLFNQAGLLIIIDSTITGNSGMGKGGGLLNEDASATLTRTRVANNQAGECGGGIANTGTGVMTLIESDITGVNTSDKAGAGLCNEATMSVTQGSEVTINEALAGGGGIYNSGTLSVRNSLVANNKALDPDQDTDGVGGGIYADTGSTTTVTQSAIVSNSAATTGGGAVVDGTFLLFNTTISDNFGGTTGGLLVMANGEATLVNVTMADNEALLPLSGIGLHVVDGTAALGNSIIASTTQDADTCTNASGTLTSLGHNLGDDDTCFGEATDLVDTDPLLAPLADGMRMPLPGSPAVDVADPVMCSETAVASVDQAGTARPQFNGCDIGAVEWPGVQLYLPIVVQGGA